MKRNIIILNIFFILLFIIFLILSLYIGSYIGFFFIPILCFLPFAFRRKSREGVILDQPQQQFYTFKEEFTKPEVRYCPVCRGAIKEPIAKYCYHCGSKLNKN